jgi:hypothetical protein
MNDEYWSIDLPGLTEQKALQIKDIVAPLVDWGVILLNPRTSMCRFHDRATVELLVKCLRWAAGSGDLTGVELSGAESLIADCEGWLAQAAE